MKNYSTKCLDAINQSKLIEGIYALSCSNRHDIKTLLLLAFQTLRNNATRVHCQMGASAQCRHSQISL